MLASCLTHLSSLLVVLTDGCPTTQKSAHEQLVSVPKERIVSVTALEKL